MEDDPASLELWGGIECTIARIGDIWRNQISETGHHERSCDIDRIVELGIKTIRYPILWEEISPRHPDKFDFGWTDARLGLLREKGVKVIGGLLHHGSGPGYTSLIDPDFPAKFAAFAARAAERYPWIESWTPINEPLTTARFSALYGHWYPHRKDPISFSRALINQCLGTLHGMRAVRAVTPSAQFLQTEDLGKVFSTRPLRYQAAYENERRWLSLDLLSGRVEPGHRFHDELLYSGISQCQLEELASGEATPDMIGINHYLTSERFLDHRTELYPGHEIGSNGRDRYVDAEAVRVKRLNGRTGIAERLKEVWKRYAIPLAITEVHHGCTREEQVRWLLEVWQAAKSVRQDGVDLRAVTLWSLFGNVDWRSLLTRKEGVYDVGAFDTRGMKPRATLVARAATALARDGGFDHPLLDTPGWWRRPERFYPWNESPLQRLPSARPLLIIGATGTLGQAMGRICRHRGLAYRLTSRSELDIREQGSVRAALDHHEPWAVINAAGFVRVADAEKEVDACLAANAAGASILAHECTAAGIPLMTFSSDLVFDGREGPYCETDRVNPTSVYGRSKAEAEYRVLAAGNKHLLIRTAAFFGAWDSYNFAWSTLNHLAGGRTVRACPNSMVSPTFVPDLCHAALDLLLDGETGIWHLANAGALSWHEFATKVADGAGYDTSLVLPMPVVKRSNTSLISTRGTILRSFDQALDAFLGDIARVGLTASAIAAE